MTCKIPRLESCLVEYQDPTKVDKLMKVDKSLSETKEVLHKTIEAVLARGEKLDDLVDKSAELSASSKAFYKTAKKTNSCCTVQ
jgi:synaptobrevin homolog YKT6